MLSNETIHQQVETLLSQMTLEEKAAQMVQVPYTVVGREEALRWAKLGAGSFLHVLGDDAREVQQAALHSRLGIPVLFGIDAIHGHGLNDHATIFPSQLSCACAWDKDIAREMGEVTAREVATDGLHWTFSPVLCLGRDTRWGRVDETFGEDPYLAGELGEAIVRGYQGDDLSDGEHILACAKHYIGYGEAVGARDACDTEMTYRRLRETFLPPFEKAFRAGCATVMTAYGSIDGTPFTADEKSMKAILRGDAVIVIDPKSSKRLRSAVIGACRAAGRPEPLEFHPAFPKRGVRLNPLGSYTRSTEIASRICAVLPRGDGAFTAFAWRAVFVMTEGMLFVGQPPTLRRFRAALERGIEELLEAALRKDLSKRVPFWEERLEALVLQQSREIRVPMGAGGGTELAAMATLWERTAGSPGSKYCPETPEAAVEGLLSRAKPTIRGPSFRSKT